MHLASSSAVVLSVIVHLQLNHNGFPMDGGMVGAGSRNQFHCLPINPLHTLVHVKLHGQLPLKVQSSIKSSRFHTENGNFLNIIYSLISFLSFFFLRISTFLQII
jgi:hypothetical protein